MKKERAKLKTNATFLEVTLMWCAFLIKKFLHEKNKLSLSLQISTRMVQALSPDDFTAINGILTQILNNDNEERKAAETQLNAAKANETDKYACLLAASLHPQQSAVSVDAKQLAAVILRRNISTEALDA